MSTAARTAGAERKEKLSGTGLNGSPASRWRFSNSRLISANFSGAAPWNENIDCFSSPTAKTVRRRERAPAPAKNSAVNAATMRHCSADVSCASSMSRWSRPLSSFRMHPCGAGRVQPARARSAIWSSKSSFAARHLGPGERCTRIALATANKASLRSSVCAARRLSRSAMQAVLLIDARSSSRAGNLSRKLFRRDAALRVAARVAFAALW